MKDDIALSKCKIDNRGDVTCSLPKSKFEILSSKGIKPRKVIFEMD